MGNKRFVKQIKFAVAAKRNRTAAIRSVRQRSKIKKKEMEKRKKTEIYGGLARCAARIEKILIYIPVVFFRKNIPKRRANNA